MNDLSFEYGSTRESIAIAEFNRQRTAQFLSAIFAVVDPKQADKLLRQYRGVAFPEERYDDIKYIKKAQELFENLRSKEIRVIPWKVK